VSVCVCVCVCACVLFAVSELICVFIKHAVLRMQQSLRQWLVVVVVVVAALQLPGASLSLYMLFFETHELFFPVFSVAYSER
jgi:hypothetical protein